MRKLIIALVLTIGFSTANACDVCRGGVGNYNPLLFPHLSKNYFGLCWMHRHYITSAEDGSARNEYYNAILLTAQYSPFKKLQLAVMAPWQLNKMQTLDGRKNISGVGDISVLANYQVFNKTNSKFRRTFVAGAGVKLPAGRYQRLTGEKVEGQNFQVGTGSTDYLLNASFHAGWRQWTVSATSSYKYNTQNKDDYRYGDVFLNGLTIVYQKEFKNFSIAPYTQMISEKQMKDADSHVLQDHSGGHVLFAGGGLDVNIRKVSGGFSYQFVTNQHLAAGNIMAKPRFSTHLLFTL
jgi:hypothetical protein